MSCLEIAAASATLGNKLLGDNGVTLKEDFRNLLEKGTRILGDHCLNAEHCLITLKCWKQTIEMLKEEGA